MTKTLRTITVLSALTFLTGCAGFNCVGWDKASPSRKDTEGTKAWSLKHNNFGRVMGCWK